MINSKGDKMRVLVKANFDGDELFRDGLDYYFRSEQDLLSYLEHLVDSDSIQPGTIVNRSFFIPDDDYRVTALNQDGEWVHDAE